MADLPRGGPRSARPTRRLRPLLVGGAALMLAACTDSTSTSGGGTANSPFVGTYQGTTTVAVSSNTGAASVSESATIFVNRDGLVQIGDNASTIYTSGPLQGSAVSLDGDAAALVDEGCSGTITLSGGFKTVAEGGAEFRGEWSSSDARCYDTAGTIDGSLTASRVNTDARASRVLETPFGVLRRAFREAAD